MLRWLVLLLVGLGFGGCASGLQTKVSGSLNNLSRNQSVAILPVQTTHEGQNEAASLFRRSLYANLKQARFDVMERYVVDSQLQQKGFTDPSQYPKISPLEFGELIGADAIVMTRMDEVSRSYLVVHSHIQVSVTVEMIDTRSGEILWRAQQTESDFQGIGKLPTGMTSALWAPVEFVTNKMNLHRITRSMVAKLTDLVKRPEKAEPDKQFEHTVIAKSASREFKQMQLAQRNPGKTGQVQVASLSARQSHAVKPSSTRPSKPKQPVVRKNAPLWNMEFDGQMNGQVRRIEPAMIAGGPAGTQLAALPQSKPALPSVGTRQAPRSAPKLEVKPSLLSTPKPKPEPSILYTLQVGAYQTKAYAERMLSKLFNLGHNAVISLFEKDEKPIYRVQTKPFKSKKDAQNLSRQLKSRHKLDTFVTRVQPRG